MAESINDKLIKLGVSYYDGTAPAAPPIRGIDGSTEDYNKVITNYCRLVLFNTLLHFVKILSFNFSGSE